MKIVVQKFGGTSVANQKVRLMAARKIINAKKSGFHPVVVVSAMGRKGEPYATDTLIDFIQSIYPHTDPREMDLIMSCGEIISAVAMVNTLKSKGYDGVALTGWQAEIITNEKYGCADVIKVNPDRIIDILEKGKIPVVTGFQGITKDGDVTTLGRGGSDITAVVLGEALSACLVEIYTDVDGIMTADPRIVPNASVLKHVSYNEVFQIAGHGARVIHPRAVEIAMKKNIPLVIKNTMNNSPGTVISSFCEENNKESDIDKEKVVTSIAYITDRTQITVEKLNPCTENKLLIDLAKNNISIDLINLFPDKMVFTIEERDSQKARSVLAEGGYRYSMISGCSKISAIGNRMRGVPGVMSRIIGALVKNNIEVLQTSDSHTTISCLVKAEDTINAVLALHEEFKLYNR